MTDGSSSRVSLAGAAVAVVAVGVGTAVGLAVVPVVGSYLGMLLGGFVAGLAVEDRPLIESGFAAVLATLGILAAGALVGNGVVAAVSALGSAAPATLLTSVVLSFAVGAFGAHFGDDLRDGLTTPVETTPTGRTTPKAPPVPSSDDQTAEERVPAPGRESDDLDTGGESTGREPERAESENLELERE